MEEIISLENEVKVEYPTKVAEDVMKHILIIGWPKAGKTTMMQHLETVHKRKIIKLDELVNWNRDNQTEGFKKFEKF